MHTILLETKALMVTKLESKFIRILSIMCSLFAIRQAVDKNNYICHFLPFFYLRIFIL